MKRIAAPVGFLYRAGLLLLLLALLFNGLPAARAESVSSPFGRPGSYVPGQIVVGIAEGFDPSFLLLPEGAQAASTPLELLEQLNTLLINVPPGQEEAYRQQLLANPMVTFAEPNYYVTAQYEPLSEPRWINQWGPQAVGALPAWDLTTGDADVIIAIVDSGIDLNHPEFAGRLLPGYDFVDKDTIPQDTCGHGTHVAGIAAATGNNGIGIAGMDWRARILPVRVLGSACGGTFADVAAGIVWATDQGADIINLSLGSGSPSTLLENSTYYAYSHGAAVIAASGNDPGPIVYPARYDWVLAVGAVDITYTRLSGSASGPELDLMAPGVDILSTLPVSGNFWYRSNRGLPNQYGYLDGSSMAAAHASGAAALLLAYNPGAFDHPRKLYDAFTSTAVDLGAVGFDPDYGWGMLDLPEAMQTLPEEPPAPPPPPVYYSAASSRYCPSVSFAWEDAKTFGIDQFITGNNQGKTISLPFPFVFGGVSYTQVTISSNGYLTFGGTGTSAENFFIPAVAQPNQMIAPYWDDLTPSLTPEYSRIYTRTFGAAPDRRFVVEWHRLKIVGLPSSELTFEAVLYEQGGLIKFQYQALNGASGDSASIGVEHDDGRSGLQWSYNQRGAVKPGEALLFLPSAYGTTQTQLDCTYISLTGKAGSFHSAPPFCLNIAADSLGMPAVVRIALLSSFSPLPAGWRDLGRYAQYTLDPRPRGLLAPPVEVCYNYTPADLLNAGGRAENLFIARFDGDRWQKLTTALDPALMRLSAQTSQLSVFGVFANQPDALPVTGAAQGRQVCPGDWR